MLLIHPPVAKPGEPPAGIARLAGALRGRGLACRMLDASLEGLLYLLASPFPLPTDTWSRRASRNLNANLAGLRAPATYTNRARYQRAVADVNRVLEQAGRARQVALNLVNYQDPQLSPLRSQDLLRAAEQPEANLFYPYFAARLPILLAESDPVAVGISLNYLSQAVCGFALAGFLKKHYPSLPLVMGGGLITSWMRNPGWRNPFGGLIDHLVAGPGEEPLLTLLVRQTGLARAPDYTGLPLEDYLAPGFILPYAAASGCYWNKCSFCPETAEENPYLPVPSDRVLQEIDRLAAQTRPVLLHFLDNAISPALMRALIARPPGLNWYGFARIGPELGEVDFCQALRRAGCVMLKLGLESGDQGVLEATGKGTSLDLVSRTFTALKTAGIATYVYLLFGTPSESIVEARRTLEYVVRHHEAIGFLNLAVFNMPICSEEARALAVSDFYQADLSLYTDFDHPRGWDRSAIRRFLDREFKRHPAVAPILSRDPLLFSSNHAPFFC